MPSAGRARFRHVGKANHHPVAVVNGDRSRNVLELSAAPGAVVKLDATGSSDPDKNDPKVPVPNSRAGGTCDQLG